MPNNWPKRKRLSAKQVQTIASAFRLDISNRRAAILRPMVRQLHRMSNALAQVEVGDTAPAATFSPRWEE